MFNIFERRKRTRRDSDLQDKMREAIRKKKEAAEDALAKLNQWNLIDRRFHSIPVDLERRRA